MVLIVFDSTFVCGSVVACFLAVVVVQNSMREQAAAAAAMDDDDGSTGTERARRRLTLTRTITQKVRDKQRLAEMLLDGGGGLRIQNKQSTAAKFFTPELMLKAVHNERLRNQQSAHFASRAKLEAAARVAKIGAHDRLQRRLTARKQARRRETVDLLRKQKAVMDDLSDVTWRLQHMKRDRLEAVLQRIATAKEAHRPGTEGQVPAEVVQTLLQKLGARDAAGVLAELNLEGQQHGFIDLTKLVDWAATAHNKTGGSAGGAIQQVAATIQSRLGAVVEEGGGQEEVVVEEEEEEAEEEDPTPATVAAAARANDIALAPSLVTSTKKKTQAKTTMTTKKKKKKKKKKTQKTEGGMTTAKTKRQTKKEKKKKKKKKTEGGMTTAKTKTQTKKKTTKKKTPATTAPAAPTEKEAEL